MTDDTHRLSEDATRAELIAAVNSLRERVSELEGSTDRPAGETTDTPGLDHYDEAAVETLSVPVAEASPRQVMIAYDRAGIVDRDTKKERAKRLKRLRGGE